MSSPCSRSQRRRSVRPGASSSPGAAALIVLAVPASSPGAPACSLPGAAVGGVAPKVPAWLKSQLPSRGFGRCSADLGHESGRVLPCVDGSMVPGQHQDPPAGRTAMPSEPSGNSITTRALLHAIGRQDPRPGRLVYDRGGDEGPKTAGVCRGERPTGDVVHG